jgi:hypothetical protein
MAFEAYLDRRGTPYVVVDEAKRAVGGRPGAKLFDYIVYPTGGPPFLVDVKGRKVSGRAAAKDARQNNWVTDGDLSGMRVWQEVFGDGFETAFVFAYWLAGRGGEPRRREAAGLDFAGREYRFWVVPAREYDRHQARRSARWRTVMVPQEIFACVSMPLERVWPAAPC